MKTLIFALVLMMGIVSNAKTLDRFPWDWGTECPFPWSEVDGYYRVLSVDGAKSKDGTYLHLVSPEPEAHEENPILEVFHFNSKHDLLTLGMGVASPEDKIIKAYTRKVNEKNATAKIYIRSYIQDLASGSSTKLVSCTNSPQVFTATFCSLKGRKCMETENYILKKLKK